MGLTLITLNLYLIPQKHIFCDYVSSPLREIEFMHKRDPQDPDIDSQIEISLAHYSFVPYFMWKYSFKPEHSELLILKDIIMKNISFDLRN